MAIALSARDQGNIDTNAAVSTAGSLSPTLPTDAILVFAVGRHVAADVTPTISGCSMTWTTIESVTAGANIRVSLHVGQNASPTSGAVTATWANTQTDATIFAALFTGCHTTATNTNHNNFPAASSSHPTITLAALQTGSITFGGALHSTNETSTPGSGYSLTNAADDFWNSVNRLAIEYHPTGSTTVDFTYATASNSVLLGCEILVAAVTSGGPLTRGGALLNGGSLAGGRLIGR